MIYYFEFAYKNYCICIEKYRHRMRMIKFIYI